MFTHMHKIQGLSVQHGMVAHAVIPAPGKQRQDGQEFKVILSCKLIWSSRSAWAAWDSVFLPTHNITFSIQAKI